MLTSKEIIKQIQIGNIEVTNLKENALRKPNSCIVSISDCLYTFDCQVVDTKNGSRYLNGIFADTDQNLKKVKIPTSGLLLEPRKLYIAKTNEKIKTNGYVPVLNGKASLSLLGLSIELNSGYLEDGYDGNLLLCLICTKPIIIYPNIEIGNLTFFDSLSSIDKNVGMISGEEIKRRMEMGDIVVTPQDNIVINPNSINLSLNKTIGYYTEPILDLKKNNPIETIDILDNGMVLYPDEIYVAISNEWTETNSLIPMISGRSSLGRLGCHVHCSAGMGSIGYKGYWHMGIRTTIPIRVYRNMKCCQIYYFIPQGDIGCTYNGMMQHTCDDKLDGGYYKGLRRTFK